MSSQDRNLQPWTELVDFFRFRCLFIYLFCSVLYQGDLSQSLLVSAHTLFFDTETYNINIQHLKWNFQFGDIVLFL